jgi:hypothetical protein
VRRFLNQSGYDITVKDLENLYLHDLVEIGKGSLFSLIGEYS